MNKDDILKDFDTLAEAKRKGAVNLKLCLGFALVVVVLVLAWGLVVNFTALDKVVVVERSGEYLKTHAEDSEALFLALVKKTCAEATGYANSFDRLNLKKNQAHAAFYVNKNDLNAVFSKYYNDKAYFDAVQNGAVYKCEIDSIQTIAGDNEPYKVAFHFHPDDLRRFGAEAKVSYQDERGDRENHAAISGERDGIFL